MNKRANENECTNANERWKLSPPCDEGEKLMGATAEREGVDREAVLRALVSGGGGGGDDDTNLDPEVMAGSSRPLVHLFIRDCLGVEYPVHN